MANISTELSNIAKAVYGEEVRGSIYDAIAKINSAIDEAINNMTDYQAVANGVITSFNNWYNSLANLLDEDVALSLANSIEELRGDVENLANDHAILRKLTDANGEYLEDGQGNILTSRVVLCVAGDSDNLTSDLVYFDDDHTVEDKINELEDGVDILEAKDAAIDEKLQEHDGDIDALEAEDVTINGKIQDLEEGKAISRNRCSTVVTLTNLASERISCSSITGFPSGAIPYAVTVDLGDLAVSGFKEVQATLAKFAYLGWVVCIETGSSGGAVSTDATVYVYYYIEE